MKNIETQNLTVGYDNTPLIESITLTVKPGQIVCLVGPNGAGKSTILKTVASVLEPLAGVVCINGDDLNELPLKKRAGLMSIMFTSRPDTGFMTCFDVVSAGRYLFTGVLGNLSETDITAVDEALKNTGAFEFRDRPFNNLSDGQKQRVLLARALAQEPEYMILDEPTGFLDIGHKLEFADTLKAMVKSKNIGVLMSMHELTLAKSIADTVISVTEDNRIDRIGASEDILTPDYIEKLFSMKPGDYVRLYGSIGSACGVRSSIINKENANRKTKVLMLQGTMSGVGKSLLTAGLCRLLTNKGYRVRPFKSQNMALNSFVTEDGYEIGRAQAMQAEACKTEPSVYMNPVLLKPTGDRSSQVIVNGRPVKNMGWAEFSSYKKELIPLIKEAYAKLEEEADIIIIEGAGSPAEINLKADDIVNMGIAKLFDAPVLLVGDIDRGGVFAQLIGTLDLLEDDERSRVKGLIVNKFRGDKAVFEPGVRQLEEKGGIKVVGVIPYMHHSLEDEDSLAEILNQKSNAQAKIKIGVVRLPHISNFTDFYTFAQFEDVSLEYITKPEEIDSFDMIILPGTKNTIGDMHWLRSKGLDRAIKEYARHEFPVIGICGGYQMLGLTITDPDDNEGGGHIEGLGLLPVDTVFAGDKRQVRVSGRIKGSDGMFSELDGVCYEGYEIHMGNSVSKDPSRISFTENDSGLCINSVCGTYVHGFFDKAEVLCGVITALAKKKGISIDTSGIKDYVSIKEADFDRLAKIIEDNMDMSLLYDILGIE